MNMHQYYCKDCGYERKGLLDKPTGIGGYATNCPECNGLYYSYVVEESEMKERIRELALLAGYKPLSPSTFADELNEIFMQKFAELIIEECADFVDNWERYQEEMLYRTILGKLPTGGSDKLKEHFGVEEWKKN